MISLVSTADLENNRSKTESNTPTSSLTEQLLTHDIPWGQGPSYLWLLQGFVYDIKILRSRRGEKLRNT